MQFSHLHTHTQYSLLDGAAPIKKLYDKAIADGMPAMAITDHGNMFGVFDFVAEAWKRKDANGQPIVKPIVGCEFYLVEDRHKKNFSRELRDKRYHQLLLAKDEVGYRNLTKLCSLGYTEGLYGKYPRIDKELLAQYTEGLIATSCCIGAEIPQAIIKGNEEEAEEKLKWWLDHFGEDYYLEVQRHGMPQEDKVNHTILKFAEKYNVPVIATNDSHYVDRDDYEAHDILLCVNTGRKLHEPVLKEFIEDDEVNRKDYRFGFFNDEFFFKTQKEMEKLFHDLPEAIDNTQRIVDKVTPLRLEKDILLPNFPIPDGFINQDQYLEHITWEGAKKRYHEITAEVEERINFELNTIKNMGFAGYFLIVSDFIKAGKDMDVYIGPGRGSAAGSVVAYCIEITNIDPIKYNLLFERFLNPDRKSMPDIDTDFEDEGRQKVIDYVVDKYGKDQVAHIVTYGTMKARSCIKDVGRVLDVPLPQVNQLTALVPDTANSLNKLIFDDSVLDVNGWSKTDIQTLRKYYNSDMTEGEILRQAVKLEGSIRNVGIHAAGIIIAPEDLSNLIPVSANNDTALNITQFEGNSIEDAGALKMDFLGLRTLSILKDCVEIVEKAYGEKIVLDDIPLDDVATYEIYQQGLTNGIFQFESAGMQTYLKQLQPDKIEDIIAMNALYRPGPMDYIPDFISRKKGIQEITYDLEGTEEYLEETYGITVYQEQVMLLAQKIANFTRGDADNLRKVMGKKLHDKLPPLEKQFMEGGIANGYPKDKLEKIWNDWKKFASYAFNKSHSTCYAIVSYQTAYFKAHYPSAFMAAVLNHSGSIDKISMFLGECKRMGIKVLGPDINESTEKFFINEKDEIRFGLGGIKGVGISAINAIIEEREAHGDYQDIYNFVERISLTAVNKKSLENLAAAGALDEIDDYHRAQYIGDSEQGIPGGIDMLINYGKAKQGTVDGNSVTLFGDASDIPIDKPNMPKLPEWPDKQRLKTEKDLLGLYLSGHPLDKHDFIIRNYRTHELTQVQDFIKNLESQWAEIRLKESLDDKELKSRLRSISHSFRTVVLIDSVAQRETRKGDPFASFNASDYDGEENFALFGEVYYNYQKYLIPGRVVLVEHTVESDYRSPGTFQMRPQKIIPIENVLTSLPKRLQIQVPIDLIDDEMIENLSSSFTQDREQMGLHLNVVGENDDMVKLETYSGSIIMSEELAEFLSGNPSVKFQFFI